MSRTRRHLPPYVFTPIGRRRAAHAAVDAGAALVLGHHPHILQGVERYRGRLIAYSLGDFVFQAPTHARKSAILRVRIAPKGIETAEWTPITIDADGRPREETGDVGRAILQRIADLTARLK